MPRQITIPSETIFETIVYIEELPNIWVRASVGKTDSNGELLPNQTSQRYTIENEDLTELLSANPSWSPSKPGGTYNNEDLWYFIDKLRV
jgi:hypothetical protein